MPMSAATEGAHVEGPQRHIQSGGAKDLLAASLIAAIWTGVVLLIERKRIEADARAVWRYFASGGR